MIDTTETTNVIETGSQPPEQRNSGNTMLTIKLLIIASVVLGVLWVLDALLAK